MRTILLCILYFFISTLSHSQWQQTGSDIDGEATDDFSGSSVSFNSDGTIVAIGAADNDENGNSSGHVRIYEFIAGNWVQKGNDIDGEAANDRSGASVSINSNGNIVAIGAPDNDGNGNNSGHVRIYEFIDGNWFQKGSDINGEAAFDRSGVSISINNSGNVIAIGANSNDGNGNTSGHVRVYAFFSPGGWIQRGNDIDGEDAFDNSGYSVSLNGDGTVVAIGTPVNDDNGDNSGHVRIFQFTDNGWIQKGSDIDGEAAQDQSGFAVSINSSGNYVAIGAPFNSDNGLDSGHVRVYQYNGSWNQLGSDIDGEAVGDISGNSVSISANGKIVAVGAFFNDGNGDASGHVRVYSHIGTSWIQIDNDIDGETAGDNSGIAVSLNDSGNKVAIGAYVNNLSTGHVRVFSNATVLNVDQASFLDTSIQLFPNPSNGNLVVQTKNAIPITKISLLDVHGRTIKTLPLNCSVCSINISNTNKSGMYFMKIYTDKGINTQKIILK